MTSTEASLETERVVAGGDALARHDSLVVFVPRALGGERVKARLTIKGRLARGDLLAVERASPDRVVPPCEHYEADRCGGCQLQHASYSAQLRIKADIVTESMRRIGHVTASPSDVRPSATEWRYRRKLTLAIRRRGGEWIAGLRRMHAPDDVFSLNDCPITAKEVVDVWRSVMRAAEFFPDSDRLRGAVRVTLDGAASFALEGGESWDRAQEFVDAVPELEGVWWTPDRGTRRLIGTDADMSAEAVTASYPIDAADTIAPHASFAQINEATSRALLDHVLGRVRVHKPRHVVDAYAGSGAASSALDDDGVRVTAIELDDEAAQWTASSVSERSSVMIARVEDALQEALPADVLLMNPPRGGVHSRVCEVIGEHGGALKAIVYVSCDPATLARDVARLPGWRVASMVCFDMFPQTAHVETVCELVPVVPAVA
ncbi:MAG TPA: hypothetical protein VE967_18060 [Gemmatimonadaceae bacterium]|nr:hypothetical protein [Gemmatimonadaceae bacterium]